VYLPTRVNIATSIVKTFQYPWSNVKLALHFEAEFSEPVHSIDPLESACTILAWKERFNQK
jgi:hypothetical protein